MINIYEHIQELATKDGNKNAITICSVDGVITEEISRTDLLKRVDGAGAYLQSLGLVAGDKIALDMGNCADLLILSWSAWGMGITTVPLDQKRDTSELRDYKVSLSGARHVIKNGVQAVQNVKVPWITDTEHDALILFTSGTTARPKGAQLTLNNLLINADSIREWLSITEADRFLVQLPLHHINSTTFCLAVLISGGSIIIPPRYSNSSFFAQSAKTRATLTSIVPSIIFDQLSKTEERERYAKELKLSRIQIGSAPVVVSDVQEFMHKFHIPLYQGYGQTETALRVTGVPTDLPPAIYEDLVAKNSIGSAMPWADVQVSKSDGGIASESEEGEIIVKGEAVMRGYIGGETAFRDGYFLTGDVGYWREIAGRRFFFLIGRAKEIIIKGGVNISPVSVEDALKKISSDIDQAYVVGVNDKRYGEEVGVVVIWKSGIEIENAMRKLKLLLLAGHETLSAYETPKYITTVRREDLPMTSTGKVQRTILKKNIEGDFESVYKIMNSNDYRFEIISPQSPLADASFRLYNHCWQPLLKTESEYRKYLNEYLTMGAIDKKGELTGQISFSYADNKITCISICSAKYSPKHIPEIKEIPSVEYVRKYLLAGNDPVMNFHKRLGAELVEVTPSGRPEDKSSLGYTMLLRYLPAKDVSFSGAVSNQLIQAVRILANDIDADVYAVSRPGGLAEYLSRTV